MEQGQVDRHLGSGGVWARIKKRWGGILFGLPFAGVGVGMLLFSVMPQLLDWHNIKYWHTVPAQVISAELNVSRDDGSSSYQASAHYSYEFQGASYSSRRVAISDSYDSVGEFQNRLGRRLERAAENGIQVTAYVNPNNPTEAVLNRELRWELVGFKMIFVVLFGGVGIGIITYLLWAPLDELAEVPAGSKPWLTQRSWASPSIKSNGKQTMIFVWCFAAFWNAIAIPTGIICVYEFIKGNTGALFGLLFPLVGAVLIIWGCKEVAKWRRFGPAPLQMDPYPGSIGGQVGGTIDVRLFYDQEHKFKVTLQCLKVYYTGSGKNRKRQESCIWQCEGYAHTEPSALGTLLGISFDVPSGLQESEPVAKRYHVWRLHVVAQLSGADFDRSYELPVFATGVKSVKAIAASVDHQQAQRERDNLLESALDVQQIPGGIAMHYPAFRHAGGKLVGVLAGGIFATVGYFIDADFMGPLFMLLGASIALGCLYFLMTSLDVRLDRQRLITERKLLGVIIKTHNVARSELTHLALAESYSSQSGKQHLTYFKIQAHRRYGKPLTIGYNFAGEMVAKQALESISMLTGVSQREP